MILLLIITSVNPPFSSRFSHTKFISKQSKVEMDGFIHPVRYRYPHVTATALGADPYRPVSQSSYLCLNPLDQTLEWP